MKKRSSIQLGMDLNTWKRAGIKCKSWLISRMRFIKRLLTKAVTLSTWKLTKKSNNKNLIERNWASTMRFKYKAREIPKYKLQLRKSRNLWDHSRMIHLLKQQDMFNQQLASKSLALNQTWNPSQTKTVIMLP